MLLAVLAMPCTTFAGSATWKASPATGDWNHAANWAPSTIPNGPFETATFATSNITGVSLSDLVEVNGITFNAGASAFTITVPPNLTLTISGVGITNNSGVAQNFATTVSEVSDAGTILFTNGATAGSGTFFTNNGAKSSSSFPGTIEFFNVSTAGNGTFVNQSAAVSGALGGLVNFRDASTAGNGAFTNHAGTETGNFGGGSVTFFDTSTASNGIFINNGSGISGFSTGGLTEFFDGSTADSATLIANDGVVGGKILFGFKSRGHRARVVVFGNGNLDIGTHHFPYRVGIGSLEGNGKVFLGGRNLTVGNNNLNIVFSGVIQVGGGFGGASGGSLTKVGTGELVLAHRSTYPGGTTIKRGKLIVNNDGGSGTGSGPVKVNGGTLGGRGQINGTVTVGTESGSRALLSPGYKKVNPGTLTIHRKLTFNSDATYKVELNSTTGQADKVVAAGVTINAGAQFSFADLGSGTLALGTVFRVINNTSETPIAGAFSNLPDGSMFSSNGNTFQASYSGGTGNDLTLTVVP
jgi:autotransporter-associated beta strand protein